MLITPPLDQLCAHSHGRQFFLRDLHPEAFLCRRDRQRIGSDRVRTIRDGRGRDTLSPPES
jgi:hypothetical protein